MTSDELDTQLDVTMPEVLDLVEHLGVMFSYQQEFDSDTAVPANLTFTELLS